MTEGPIAASEPNWISSVVSHEHVNQTMAGVNNQCGAWEMYVPVQ